MVEENDAAAEQDIPKSEAPRIQFAPEPLRDDNRTQNIGTPSLPAGKL
jgi:hypothetical protein